VRVRSSLALGVDVGQSGMRARVVDADGLALLDQAGPGLSPGTEPVMGSLSFIQGMVSAAAVHGRVESIALGVTGTNGRVPAINSDVLAAARNFGARRFLVADDSYTSYVGAVGLSGEPAAVVAAGTGVVVLATNAEDRWSKVDGWGPQIGDLGSGSWLGRQGLVSAMQAFDGRGGSQVLLEALQRVHGDVIDFAHATALGHVSNSVIASFAEEVAVAARAGDALSAELWRQAGEYLARALLAAYRQVAVGYSPPRVSGVGSLFAAGDLLFVPLMAALTSADSRTAWLPPAGTSLDGAVSLARRNDRHPSLEPLIRVSSLEELP
jgi:glucosamine kinase